MQALTIEQLEAWKPPHQEWVIEHVLPTQGKMLLFGPPKSWKSMLAMHTAYSVGMGWPWFGYKTSKLRTLVAQFEISQAMYRKRVLKYKLHETEYPGENFKVVTEHYIKFDTGYGYKQLDDIIAKEAVQLVIIDPLYKVFSGHITDPKDAQKFIDNMDLLIAKHDCSMIVIHHKRKPQVIQDGVVDRGAEEAIGSSYFGNWIDAAVSTKLLADKEGYVEVGIRFDLIRHAEMELLPLKIKIPRATLHPTVMAYDLDPDEFEEKDISIRQG